jgi:DNA-binding beta-propeller fold protein YncE
VPVGKTPADIYLTPDDKNILVALTGGTGVQVYDVSNGPAKLVKTIQTGSGAHAFRSQGDKQHLFVSNRAANTISRIDLKTMSVVDTYATPAGPDCMEVLADGKTLLVTARWAGKLAVVDLQKKVVVKQVPVGKSPHGVWVLNHASRV